MKLCLILDQIQSGMGTKDDAMLPLGGKTTAIGPGLMMESFLKDYGAVISASLYCGDGYYRANREEVSKKMVAMIAKMKPDVIICGPAFNFQNYAQMAAELCAAIGQTGAKVFAAMSEENSAVIEEYKNKILIVKTPKKGGTGLNDALRNMCRLANALYKNEDYSALKAEVCF